MRTNQNTSESDRECFENVGILLSRFKKKLKGDLYKYPEDFTVREVHSEGICQVEKLAETVIDFKSDYIHGLLVKKNISTFEACDTFCRENGLDYFSDISFCGLKDTLGLTSQLICIKNKHDMNIKRMVFDDFFITNLKGSDKKLHVGDHVGNNFTIRVRNVSNAPEETIELLKNFSDMTMKGLPNFYGLQRFGVRQDNHVLGKLLLKGHYEEFTRKFITYSKNEPEEITKIRGVLSENFGDWHRGAHVWIVKDEKIMLQKRSASKDFFSKPF